MFRNSEFFFSFLNSIEVLVKPRFDLKREIHPSLIVGPVYGFCTRDSTNQNSSNNYEKLAQDLDVCEIDSDKRPVRDPSKITYVTVRFQPAFLDIVSTEKKSNDQSGK